MRYSTPAQVRWFLATLAVAALSLASPSISLWLAWRGLSTADKACHGVRQTSLVWSFQGEPRCDSTVESSVTANSIRTAKLIAYAERWAGQTAGSLHARGRAAAIWQDLSESSRLLSLASILQPSNPEIKLEFAISQAKLGFAADSPELMAQGLDEMLKASSMSGFPARGYIELAVLAENLPAPRSAIRLWKLAIDRHDLEPALAEFSKRRLADLQSRLALRVSKSKDVVEPDRLARQTGYGEALLLRLLGDWLANPEKHRENIQLVRGFLEKQRHDLWLSDLLLSPATQGGAIHQLASSFQANLNGNPTKAESEARLALDAFRRNGNAAGSIGASIELATALANSGKLVDCLINLNGVARRAADRHYQWLSLRARFAEMLCQTENRTVDMIAVREGLVQDTAKSGFVDLQLRSISAVAEPLHSYGTPAQAWRMGRRGLNLFWQSPMGGISGSNLYVPLAMAAANQGLADAAAVLMEEAAGALSDSPNRRLNSGVQMEAGRYLSRSSRPQDAVAYLDRSLQIDPSRKRDIDGAKAEIALQEGRPQQALSLVANLAANPASALALNHYQRFRLLPVLGRAQLATGDLTGAAGTFLSITEESLNSSRKIADAQQRYFVMLEGEQGWRGLADDQYRSGKAAEALATWQTFRSGGSPLDLGSLRPDGAKTSWLSFAAFGDEYLGWLWNGSSLTHHRFTGSGIATKVTHLSRLVNDPASPQSVIAQLAAELGDLLLGPFAAELRASRVVAIDADGLLASVPWPVVALNGRPLVETQALVLCHGWAEAMRRPAAASPSDLRRALVVRRATVGPTAREQFPLLISDQRETRPLKDLPGYSELSGVHAIGSEILSVLENVEIFHFAGHGIAWGSGGGLVLSPESGAEPFGLLTASALLGHSWRHLQLVVLASCSSSGSTLRANPNFESVAKAFLQSGARQVIASRWNIDSSSTADILERFYGSFMSGDSAAIALQNAMVAVKKLPNSSHPYYWAGLAIYGAP